MGFQSLSTDWFDTSWHAPGPEAVLFHRCGNAYRIILTVPQNHSFTGFTCEITWLFQSWTRAKGNLSPLSKKSPSQRQRVDSLPLWRRLHGKLRCLQPGVAVTRIFRQTCNDQSNSQCPVIARTKFHSFLDTYQESHISNIDHFNILKRFLR